MSLEAHLCRMKDYMVKPQRGAHTGQRQAGGTMPLLQDIWTAVILVCQFPLLLARNLSIGLGVLRGHEEESTPVGNRLILSQYILLP